MYFRATQNIKQNEEQRASCQIGYPTGSTLGHSPRPSFKEAFPQNDDGALKVTLSNIETLHAYIMHIILIVDRGYI